MMLVLLFQSSSYVQIVAYTILMCLKKKKKRHVLLLSLMIFVMSRIHTLLIHIFFKKSFKRNPEKLTFFSIYPL